MSDRFVIFNARLIDPASGRDETGGVVVENGQILETGAHVRPPASPSPADLDARGLCLSPGLIDLRVKTGEPGGENKETLETASAAAAA